MILFKRIAFIFIFISIPLLGISQNRQVKKQQKEYEKKRLEKQKQLEEAQKLSWEKHMEMQSKEVQKKMKKQLKEAQKYNTAIAGGKKLRTPWYKKWFQKRTRKKRHRVR